MFSRNKRDVMLEFALGSYPTWMELEVTYRQHRYSCQYVMEKSACDNGLEVFNPETKFDKEHELRN
jgi:hypothetical protein